MKVLVNGAGIGGLCAAYEFASRGAVVTLKERNSSIGGNPSWQAGGMLAPWCEGESAEECVVELGTRALDWWTTVCPDEVVNKGTLVVAAPRDVAELNRFGSQTTNFEVVDGTGISDLEPHLSGRFRKGLFFSKEAHIDPRRAMQLLHEKLLELGVDIQLGVEGRQDAPGFDFIVNSVGMKQKDARLRGVRGEMLIVRTPDVSLSRPVRLLHPRIPLYIVPRADHHFMIGATMIESDAELRPTVRAVVELLNASFTLHPAFAEAEIVEMNSGVRPAYADNVPRVERSGRLITINGFYRHGYLTAPTLAQQAADMAFEAARTGELTS